MTFDRGVEPKVFRAIQHVNMEELAKCTEQEIRPVLPCLVRMGLISPLDTSKKCMNMKVTILTIVSGMELVNSIVALLSIDFHKLEIDVKKEQQLRQKGNTLLNDSVLIGNLSNTSMALEYERSDMTRRLSILLGELLYIHSQIQDGAETNEQESYIKSSELFDNDIFAEELSDIICIALAELPTTLNMCTLVETLLHVHNGPAIICRIVANFPDSFREVTTYLIQTGEKQEENISSVVRTSAISLICKMNPSQALSIRNKCVDLCRMPALAITLSLEQNKNICDDVDGDMVAFISGLLLGNDQTIRNWIALFIRTGQKRKGEVSSNALQQLRDELLKRLQKIIEASSEGELPDSMVVQASALLRLYCALRGIAAIKFQDDEVNYIVQLLTSHPNPTPAGVRFVSIGLCMLIACPSLISLPEHERKNIEWVQWLVKEEAYFETASGVSASFGEMLLLMAIHFHSNQLSAICDLVCATLGMKIAIRHNNMTRMKQVFTQEIFTEQVVTAHAVKVPVTNSLNANMTGFLPIHCIHQLLKSRAFAKHNVNIKKWIYKQICTSVSPLHPVLRMLVEVYVNSIILPNTKNSEHTNKPLTENEIRKVFQSSIFGQYFDQKQSIFTMDFDLSSEYQDVVVDNTSLTPQLLLLYYLLLYEDCRLNNAYILAAVEQTGTKIKKYTPEFMSELPIKYLLHHAQKDQSSYSGLFGPLLKLLATHFPHLTLVEDWLDDMAIQTEYKPTHISEISVIEAFSEIENNPLKCAKLLQNLLKKEAIDIWPFVEIFTQHAKNFLADNVPRYLQDLYRDVWFRLNTVLPRRLWVLTVKNLVEDCSSLSRIDVAEDPLQIMRCDERVFRCAPMYAVVLRVLRASLASSRSQLMQHFLSNLKFEQSGQVMNESDREEMRRACIAAQVFDYPPEGVRKCIISTNIAETSVTIDGIRFVIDSGKVNRMSYNTNVGVNKLSECNISQDSAKQRAGRAGRTGPGTCFRLYSEEDLKSFEPFTPAEIHQVPLDSLLLHMISLGLHDIANFPFLEKPTSRSLEESMEKLKFIGALELDKEYLKLTQLGDSLSQLPVDLTIGKMLILSTVFGNINSVLALASLLSIQSPLTQQSQRDLQARELRKPLESDHGDPLTLLNYYKEWLNVKQSYTPAKHHSKRDGVSSKVWARKRCLEEQRFYEATKLIEQFREILQEAELLPKLSEAGLSSGERSIRLGELKQLKSMRYRMKNEEKRQNRKQLKYEMYDAPEGDEDGGKMDIRDVEFRITNDFKKLQRLLNEASADTHKDLVLLKLILASGLYPQVAVEDEFNSSKTVLERLYHTKNKNYVFLRPDSYFASNPEVLELHNDDVEVPPPGYFSRRSISRKHQILIYQTILETKKVYLVNAMRMPALQTLLLLGKTVAANETFTKFVIDDFLMIDAPYFGQGKALLLKALTLRRVWKDKLQSKLKDPTNTKIDQREIFYFTEDLIAYMTTEVSYNIKRLLPADLKDIFSHDCRIFESEKISENNKNPFCKDYKITKNFELGGINVTENLVYGCLLQEEWAYAIEQEIINTEFVCKHCKKSRLGSTLFGNIRHETFCSKRSDETAQEPEETEEVVIQPNSKLYHCNVCNKDLMLTPESAAIQMLIETCSETDLDKTIPGRQWALQEVRSLVCSYLHQAFIADTTLCKLVHFQTYPSELIEIVVKGVPSMHICLDFLQELMQQPSLNKQIFGIQLLSHISLQYALPKSLNLCISALNLLYALLGGVSSAQRVKLFKPVLPALVRISEAFPPLTDDIINLLMQLAKICESQASLASHFDAHLGKSLEIASKESGELCDLTQRTFSEILDKAVLKAKIYKQD